MTVRHKRTKAVVLAIPRSVGCCLRDCAASPVNLSNRKPMPYQTSGTKGIAARIAPVSFIVGKAILNGMDRNNAGRFRAAVIFIATGIGLATSHTIGGCGALKQHPACAQSQKKIVDCIRSSRTGNT